MWALDDEKVKELIKCRFPKAATDPKQRKLAARMLRLIHLYYRVGSTSGAVAEELKMSVGAVEKMLLRLNNQMSGPLKPSHRPKKGGGIGASSGSQGEDHISL